MLCNIKKEKIRYNQYKSTEIRFDSCQLKEIKQEVEEAKSVKMKIKDDSNTLSGKSQLSSVMERQKATSNCLTDITS